MYTHILIESLILAEPDFHTLDSSTQDKRFDIDIARRHSYTKTHPWPLISR